MSQARYIPYTVIRLLDRVSKLVFIWQNDARRNLSSTTDSSVVSVDERATSNTASGNSTTTSSNPAWRVKVLLGRHFHFVVLVDERTESDTECGNQIPL